MNSRLRCLGVLSFFLLIACSKESTDPIIEVDLDKALIDALDNAAPNGRFFHFILADENNLQHLPNQDPHNAITREKVKLGKSIFFDPGLAQDANDASCYETYSCSTCHVPESGFLPGRIQGIADGAFGFGVHGSERHLLTSYEEQDLDAQGVRPLTTMNVAYMTNTLWSGLFGAKHVNEGTEDVWVGTLPEVNHLGFIGLESQNIEGVRLHRMAVNEHVLDDLGYRTYFDAAFPEMEENDRYSDQTISFALGAYLRTILTTRAPFQKWLKGDRNAITDQQKEGALLFFGEARCYKCHNSPALSSMNFHALGTSDLYLHGGVNTSSEDPRNLGRGMFTQDPEDNYRFKVPQLYNLKAYKTFFHGSSKTTLAEVIDFKIKASSENDKVPQEKISPLFQPLDLTEQQRLALLDFLENALYDPDMDRYVPSSVISGYCFPNNDGQSKEDIGCN
ncbi:MAG: hypothetical protein KDC80_18985 [Saprospiraceae bacterium]|nr:hypothetical protein [Saprospiraceae bacterium]